MHMYPYPPPPPYNMQGGPPGSSSAGGAPSGGGGGGPPAYPGYPPGMHGHMSMSMPMPYPPMPYPGQCAAAKGPFTFHDQSAENSSTSGSDTDGEEDQASEEGSVDDGDAPITSSSTAALDLSDDDTDHHVYDSSRAAREVATQAQLPVAVPLPVSEVQLPSLDKTVSLVRRGQHHRAGGNHNHSFNYSSDRSAELIIAPYSAEPRIGYEVIQQRIADKAAARATRVAVSTSD